MGAPSSSLTHCPVCRYDLRGLPREHRCPECGFCYDETTRVWRVPVVPKWALVVVWLTCVITFQATLIRLAMFVIGINGREASAVLFVLGGALPLVLYHYPRGFVAVSRVGLSFRFPLRSAVSLPWSAFRVSSDARSFYRIRHGLHVPIILPTIGLLWKHRRPLHAEIARRWHEATADPAAKT